MKTHQITSHDMTWHLATNHITSPHVTSQPTALLHRSLQPTTSKQVTTSPPWNGWRPVHSNNSVWASQWLVTLCAFYRQILSLTYIFFLETSAPGLPGSTCIYIWVHLLGSPRSPKIRDEISSNLMKLQTQNPRTGPLPSIRFVKVWILALCAATDQNVSGGTSETGGFFSNKKVMNWQGNPPLIFNGLFSLLSCYGFPRICQYTLVLQIACEYGWLLSRCFGAVRKTRTRDIQIEQHLRNEKTYLSIPSQLAGWLMTEVTT